MCSLICRLGTKVRRLRSKNQGRLGRDCLRVGRRLIDPVKHWYTRRSVQRALLMTLTIELPPATLERLHAEAAATGKDVQTVVREAVEARFAARRQTFADILKSLHDEVE